MYLYEKPDGVTTRWASFENPTATRGSGGRENRGAKGHAFDSLEPGETKTLLDITGSGTITRLWVTLSDRSPERLRSLWIEMYWDGATEPAVSAPLGDFFGIGLGRTVAFECTLFSNPEGRSFNAFIPMPFRQSARVTITNTAETRLSHLFYDIDLLLGGTHTPQTHYFHTHWREESPNALGQDLQILPFVPGSGRFLGCNVGVTTHPQYGDAWWGEGEVKVWLGDEEYPTLCGTGTEDYIGTGWGQGAYAQQTQGCPIADKEARQWAFYRYHLPDPIYFDDGCRVSIQTIGGTTRERVMEMQKDNVPLIPVSIDTGQPGGFICLMNLPQPVDLATQPEGWCNFWRQDTWCATAYFYHQSAEGVL
jgi:hypothetical protein